jgi:hypothetical protein
MLQVLGNCPGDGTLLIPSPWERLGQMPIPSYRTGLSASQTESPPTQPGDWNSATETDVRNCTVAAETSENSSSETVRRPANSRECRKNLCGLDNAHRDRTGWLGRQDSNLEMSFCKMPFEMSHEFRLILEHLGTRDFSRASCLNTYMHLRLDCMPGRQDTNRSLLKFSDIRLLDRIFSDVFSSAPAVTTMHKVDGETSMPPLKAAAGLPPRCCPRRAYWQNCLCDPLNTPGADQLSCRSPLFQYAMA